METSRFARLIHIITPFYSAIENLAEYKKYSSGLGTLFSL